MKEKTDLICKILMLVRPDLLWLDLNSLTMLNPDC